LTQLPTAR
jgi:hypothetical protein